MNVTPAKFCFLISLIGFTSAGFFSSARAQTSESAEVVEAAAPTVHVFPRRPLFAPLAADPRWPKLSIGYQYYFGDSEFTHIGVAEAGASIPIVQRSKGPHRGSWELGIQGGIFANFDFGAPSNDLVNADYLGAVTFAYAFQEFALSARYIHQSSHLGDEYLLRHPSVTRLNLSYEELNLLGSYDALQWLRVYGGGAAIVRADPSSLDRWSVQTGLEARPITAKTKVRLQLLIALDLRLWQENNWKPDVSFVIGPTLDPGEKSTSSYRVDFLLKYYYGHSRAGQFFSQQIHTLGPVAQLYF